MSMTNSNLLLVTLIISNFFFENLCNPVSTFKFTFKS